MSWSMAAFTFLNAWWLMLFVALPFGIEKAEKAEGIDYVAAPRRIYWKRILVTATLLALAATGGLALLLQSGIVPLREGYG